MNKPDLAVAIADALDIWGDADAWVSNGETVKEAWHQVVGEVLGVPYELEPEKVRHMERLLAAVGVEWNESRHSSRGTRSGGGGNIKKEAYEDLLAAILTADSDHASYT